MTAPNAIAISSASLENSNHIFVVSSQAHSDQPIQTNEHSEKGELAGRKVSGQRQWKNLLLSQTINIVITAFWVTMGAVTANPWMMSSSLLSGIGNTAIIMRNWSLTENYTKEQFTYNILSLSCAALFGRAIGGPYSETIQLFAGIVGGTFSLTFSSFLYKTVISDNI